ncbi:MAG TPA: hypothetical protein VGN17_30025 [Bryobacteraceae bacterium]|jgi:hypothetical protein
MIDDIFVSGAIIFLSAGLLTYFCWRSLIALRASEEEFGAVLDLDLAWGRRTALMLRILLLPSSQALAGW